MYRKKWSLSTMQDTNVDIKLMSSPLFSSNNSQETQWRMTSTTVTVTTIVKVHVAMFQPLFSEMCITRRSLQCCTRTKDEPCMTCAGAM
jgi:hypothetical protein